MVNGTPLFAEESIRAYKHAARHGFVLEVDAKLTEDRVPVALHDATLDRTTNCSGELRTFTLVELSGCRTDVLGSPGSPLPTRSAGRTVAGFRLHPGVCQPRDGRGARQPHPA